MTSDAKIGLLLGLVFIFVIAFIINGLPNLRPQTSRVEILKNTNTVDFTNQGIGIADDAQAQAAMDWNPAPEREGSAVEAVQVAIEQSLPAAQTPEQQPETAVSQDVRFESPLPRIENPLSRVENPLSRIENLLQRFSVAQQGQNEPPTPVDMSVSLPPTDRTAIQTPVNRAAETVVRNTELPRASQPPFVKPAGKVYVVEDGESLSSLAKRAYGLEEGNRIVNVNRIFEANRDVLKSADEVRAGQQLVVPPLPKPAVNPNRPSDVLSGDLFERVQALRRPVSPQTPAPTVQTRWYTVQEGDNLWRIASSQLGAGARYDEVAKLNADLLKDPSKVDPGTKIRLPLK